MKRRRPPLPPPPRYPHDDPDPYPLVLGYILIAVLCAVSFVAGSVLLCECR